MFYHVNRFLFERGENNIHIYTHFIMYIYIYRKLAPREHVNSHEKISQHAWKFESTYYDANYTDPNR